jgi:hypothetical protein
MVERYRIRNGFPLDDDEAAIHRESAEIVQQLLSVIGESRLVRRRFEVRWLAKVDRKHDLDVLKATVQEALNRAY